MNILVTGADGLLGNNLIRELLHRGHSIRAFLQPERKQVTLNELNIEKYFGNLLNQEEILQASKECDAIIHLAAIIPPVSKKHRELTMTVNYGGKFVWQVDLQILLECLYCLLTLGYR